MTNKINIIVLSTLFMFLSSCVNKEMPYEGEEATGASSLTINFAVPADVSSRGEQLTEEYFEDILVILVDHQNTILAKAEANDLTDKPKQYTLTLDNIKIGSYTLYAYANDKRLTAKVGDTFNIDEAFKKDEALNYKLLTGKTDLSIGSGANSATIQMEHPLARLRMLVFNQSNKNIQIKTLKFGEFNPSTSFVFSHEGEMPDTTKYTALADTCFKGEGAIKIPPGQQQGTIVYEAYMYENKRPKEYYYTMSVDVLDQIQRDYTLTSKKPSNGDLVTISSDEGYFLHDAKPNLKAELLTGNEFTSYQSLSDHGFLWKVETENNHTYFARPENTWNHKYYLFLKEPNKDQGNSTWGIAEGFVKWTWDQTEFDVKRASSWLINIYGCFDLTNDLVLKATEEGVNKDHTQWNFHKVDKATFSGEGPIGSGISIKSPIMLENHTMGEVKPLTQIRRNQFIAIVVNVYFSEQEDKFTFEVNAWDEKENDFEFN